MHQEVPLQIVSPEELDILLEAGFRFLGKSFFRYSYKYPRFDLLPSFALRIRLEGFKFSKSQRKILRKNADIKTTIGTYTPSSEKTELFDKHYDTFGETVKYGIQTYIHDDSATLPTASIERCLYLDKQLIAVSICHFGAKSHNATYCFYDPRYKRFSLGTYTLLLEIQAAKDANMDYYYLGYVCISQNENLYKMNFNNLERLDWESMEWKDFERQIPKQKS